MNIGKAKASFLKKALDYFGYSVKRNFSGIYWVSKGTDEGIAFCLVFLHGCRLSSKYHLMNYTFQFYIYTKNLKACVVYETADEGETEDFSDGEIRYYTSTWDSSHLEVLFPSALEAIKVSAPIFYWKLIKILDEWKRKDKGIEEYRLTFDGGNDNHEDY